MRRITKDEIINISKNILIDNNNLTRMEFYKLIKSKNNISKKVIFTRFGKLDNLAKECNHIFIGRKIGNRLKSKFTQKEVLVSLKKLFDKHKYINKNRLKEYYKTGEIICHTDTIRNLCGSLDYAAFLIDAKFTNKNEITKNKILKKLNILFNKYPKLRKRDLNDLKEKKLTTNPLTSHFGSPENAVKLINKKFCKRVYGKKYNFIGKNEKFILDNIEKEKNIKLLRQYNILNYFVDGYDKENNIVYEVDEIHHKFRKEEDCVRENNIKEEVGCCIVRINEQMFLKNIC